MNNGNQTIWKSDGWFIGYWNDYPDYWTQGKTENELRENLDSLRVDLESGDVPFIEKKAA